MSVMTRSELRQRAQELRGACGGAEYMATFFGPSDLVELLDEIDRLESEVANLRSVPEGVENYVDDSELTWLMSRIGKQQ